SIRFNVGLSAATNSLLPEPSDSTFYRPNMWFGNTVQPWQGYIFVNFQGKIDTSNAGNLPASQMQPFVYKIGTNASLKNVVMPDQNYSVLPDQTQFIHIKIYYNNLFNGIKLNNSANLNISTPAANSGTLATQIVNNIPAMFIYE
ncbi:MAG TPA: MbnP family protein, partial [Bacteroidia bacterium]|nr:MbnP family protein [Bacteroidia bacterium]